MGKKKRPHRTPPGAEADTPEALPRAPERLASPFKDALGKLKQELVEQAKQAAQKPPPPPPLPKPVKRTKALEAEDAMALSLAMQGVKPLHDDRPSRVTHGPKLESRTAKVAPFGSGAEDQARARLDALVAQDVRFRIERDGDWVSAVRSDAPSRLARELARRTRVSESLDLHGMSTREAHEAVASFIKRMHRQGIDTVCIVHGKGQHSEGGLGVLRDVVIRALTETAAAPLVAAFVRAPDALGGAGALLVELKR